VSLTIKRRAEFARDEGVEGAEASGELGGGQAAIVVEPTEMVYRGKIGFLQVAFPTAGDKVAVGMILQLGKRDNVVEAAGKGGKPATAIKTTPAFPQMDGATQSRLFIKVQLFEIGGASGA